MDNSVNPVRGRSPQGDRSVAFGRAASNGVNPVRNKPPRGGCRHSIGGRISNGVNKGAIYEEKWRKFLKRTWPFRFIPFIDFVLAAGSLAVGNAHKDSDFDVIIGARQGRIFTARFFCVLLFGILGWRRKSRRSEVAVISDRVCFNHFVTSRSYCLSAPRGESWRALYLNLVPVLGEAIAIQKFFDANAGWTVEKRLYQEDSRHLYKIKSRRQFFLENLLSGRFGDWLERRLKRVQVKRIEQSLKKQESYEPRIIYTDEELEFHPDTRRTIIAAKDEIRR